MNFGINLKRKRVEKGYTQEQFSELLGVSRQAVSLWESDSGYPEVEKLLEIAKILDVSLDWLFFDSQDNRIKTVSSDGKITIHSPTENVIARCSKVASTQKFKGKENEPSYALFAAGDIREFMSGEKRTIIGWYKNKEDIAKETEEIFRAISDNQNSYTLKYAVAIKQKGLKLEIEE